MFAVLLRLVRPAAGCTGAAATTRAAATGPRRLSTRQSKKGEGEEVEVEMEVPIKEEKKKRRKKKDVDETGEAVEKKRKKGKEESCYENVGQDSQDNLNSVGEASHDPPPASPLIYPAVARAAKHHDLPSFLRHVEYSGLDPGSTTYVGTHYEYTVAARLATLGFALQRVGGASDRGIDLLGTWKLPLGAEDVHRHPIRVLLQCKGGPGQRIGPRLIRELEGAFTGVPEGWRTQPGGAAEEEAAAVSPSSTAPVVGLLVTEKTATKGIRDALARSRWPMGFLCCSGTGTLQQMLWNRCAEQQAGLAGLGVALRHPGEPGGNNENGAEAHIVLTWQGRRLPFVAADVD